MSLSFTTYPVAPAQFLENNTQGASQHSLCLLVGDNLYYVTLAQTGAAEGTLFLWIMKSVDGGATWAQIFNADPTGTGCGVLSVNVIGTDIWIFLTNGQNFGGEAIQVFVFDTILETLAEKATGPGTLTSFNPISAVLLPESGLFLVTYFVAGDGKATLYDPDADSWGAIVSLGLPLFTVALVVEPTIDRAYLLGVSAAGAQPLICMTIDGALALGNPQELIASVPESEFVFLQYNPGLPVIFDGEVCFLYLHPGSESAAENNVLNIFRAPLAKDPAFTDEIIAGPLGPLNAIGSFGADKISSSCLMVISGILHCFYWSDNNQGFAGSGLSQSFLNYQTNTGPGDGWGSATIAYTSDVPAEPLTPYPVQISSTDFGILFGLIDPTLFFDGLTKYSSLSTWFTAFSGGAGSPLSISCGGPSSGRVLSAYTHSFPAAGGVAPYTFALTSGALPPGLHLNAATGVVSGLPTRQGLVTFDITVTDSAAGTDTVSCSISILQGVSGGGGNGGGSGGPAGCCCIPDLPALDAVRMARAEARAALWPFPWRTPPPNSEHVFKRGILAAPLTSARAVLLSYRVPNTMRFVLDGLVLYYSGEWVPGDGSVSFSLSINNPAGVVDASQGRPFKDYANVLLPLGSPFDEGPWSIESGERSILESRDILTAAVVVNPLLITGGQFIAIFRGWLFPE